MKQRLFLLFAFGLLVLGSVVTLGQYLWFALFNPTKAFAVAVMIDKTTNTALNGKPDTTISARTARARNRGKAWGCFMCDVYAEFQANHCDIALADAPAAASETPPA